MPSSAVESELEVQATAVNVTDETITVNLADGRAISVPTAWYPRLKQATAEERANYEISEFGIEWPDVEADFSIRALLLGRRSGENRECFRFWLSNRRKGRRVTVMQWLEQHQISTSKKGQQNFDSGPRRGRSRPSG